MLHEVDPRGTILLLLIVGFGLLFYRTGILIMAHQLRGEMREEKRCREGGEMEVTEHVVVWRFGKKIKVNLTHFADASGNGTCAEASSIFDIVFGPLFPKWSDCRS